MVAVTLILLVVAVFALDYVLERYRAKKLCQARLGWTICNFARAFPKAERDARVLRAVYAYFSQWMTNHAATFPVRPDDVISRVYRMDLGEVDIDLPDLAREARRSLAEPRLNPCTVGYARSAI